MTKWNVSGQRGKTAAQRFDEKVDRLTEGCWRWTSAIGSRGYGVFWASSERRSVFAHRFAWELANGSLPPDDMLVMHACDNPWCVNPSHLSLGSTRENQLDASRKGRNAKGIRNGGGVKLNDDKVRQIKSSELPSRKIAKQFGVSETTILRIRAGKNWSHVG